jgi:hypothetical protein
MAIDGFMSDVVALSPGKPVKEPPCGGPVETPAFLLVLEQVRLRG